MQLVKLLPTGVHERPLLMIDPQLCNLHLMRLHVLLSGNHTSTSCGEFDVLTQE